MITDVQAAAEPPRDALFLAIPESTTFEGRWAAWQAKGGAHDRAVRRQMMIAAPILLIVVAVISALLAR